MSRFEGIVTAPGSLAALAVTALLLILIPVGAAVWWRRKHKDTTTLRYLIAGALGFLITVRVLELGVHYFCLLSDNSVSRFINGSTLAYVLYGIIMAGVFEECGRYIIMKYIVKKDRTRENAVFYGIGHGGIEVLAVILPSIISLFYIALLFSKGDTAAALSALNITEDIAAAAYPQVLTAANYSLVSGAITVVERILTMFVHTGLSVLVFYGVVNNKKGCLPLAIVLHMAVDTVPAIYQRGGVSIAVCELWCAVWAAVIAFTAVKKYKKMQ